MAHSHHHGRAGGGGLVAPVQRFPRFDDRQRPRRGDVQRLQHLGRQDFAHTAFEGQATIAETTIRRLPRALGAQFEQAAIGRRHLCEGEAAPVAQVAIILAELMPVIAQRQRPRQRLGQGCEPAEMGDPFVIGQGLQPDLGRRAVVAEANDRLREIGGRDRIGEEVGDLGEGAGGAIGLRG